MLCYKTFNTFLPKTFLLTFSSAKKIRLFFFFLTGWLIITHWNSAQLHPTSLRQFYTLAGLHLFTPDTTSTSALLLLYFPPLSSSSGLCCEEGQSDQRVEKRVSKVWEGTEQLGGTWQGASGGADDHCAGSGCSLDLLLNPIQLTWPTVTAEPSWFRKFQMKEYWKWNKARGGWRTFLPFHILRVLVYKQERLKIAAKLMQHHVATKNFKKV